MAKSSWGKKPKKSKKSAEKKDAEMIPVDMDIGKPADEDETKIMEMPSEPEVKPEPAARPAPGPKGAPSAKMVDCEYQSSTHHVYKIKQEYHAEIGAKKICIPKD